MFIFFFSGNKNPNLVWHQNFNNLFSLKFLPSTPPFPCFTSFTYPAGREIHQGEWGVFCPLLLLCLALVVGSEKEGQRKGARKGLLTWHRYNLEWVTSEVWPMSNASSLPTMERFTCPFLQWGLGLQFPWLGPCLLCLVALQLPPQLLASSSFLSVVVIIVILLLQTGILTPDSYCTTRNMHFSLLPSRRVQLSDLAPAYLTDVIFPYSLSLLHLSHAGLIFSSNILSSGLRSSCKLPPGKIAQILSPHIFCWLLHFELSLNVASHRALSWSSILRQQHTYHHINFVLILCTAFATIWYFFSNYVTGLSNGKVL